MSAEACAAVRLWLSSVRFAGVRLKRVVWVRRRWPAGCFVRVVRMVVRLVGGGAARAWRCELGLAMDWRNLRLALESRERRPWLRNRCASCLRDVVSHRQGDWQITNAVRRRRTRSNS